jgi:hypothetical protein
MADDCPECRRNQMLAAQMRGLADAILVPVNALTRLPPGATQAFVEGATTGAVAAAKAPRSKKASAYGRRYKSAFKRQAMKYRKQNGSWKKDGFKRAVRAAHKEAKR